MDDQKLIEALRSKVDIIDDEDGWQEIEVDGVVYDCNIYSRENFDNDFRPNIDLDDMNVDVYNVIDDPNYPGYKTTDTSNSICRFRVSSGHVYEVNNIVGFEEVHIPGEDHVLGIREFSIIGRTKHHDLRICQVEIHLDVVYLRLVLRSRSGSFTKVCSIRQISWKYFHASDPCQFTSSFRPPLVYLY